MSAVVAERKTHMSEDELHEALTAIVSRFGDPTLLDDPEALRRIIASTPEADRVGITRIAAIAVTSAMGFCTTDGEAGILNDDSLELDYGSGNGAAVRERRTWIGGFLPGATGSAVRRTETVAVIADALGSSGMLPWLVELVVALSEDWSSASYASMQQGLEQVANDLFRSPTAPSFARPLAARGKELSAVYPTLASREHNDDECSCGCPWLRLRASGENVVHSVCLITAVTGLGCKKTAVLPIE
jgi:hypothetical protein